MSDLALDLSKESVGTDAHHDLVIGPSGDLQLTNGLGAIQQAVVQALKQFSQDWFLDMGAGLPYRSQLFNGRDLSASFQAVMQNRILTVPGVLGLLTWDAKLSRRNRMLAVNFSAQCTGGVVQWSIGLDGN